MARRNQDRLAPFTFHGLEFTSSSGNQSIATCPLCGHEDKFYVNRETGQWDCKVCYPQGGNIYTFLGELHQQAWAATTQEDYERLSQARGNIPRSTYDANKVAWDGERWLIPVFNENDTIVNLHVWRGSGPILSTSTCSLHLIRGNGEFPTDRPIYVCEGFWDTFALAWAVQRASRRARSYRATVIGVPGAGTFKQEWGEKFRDHDVCLLYDNDRAGTTGMSRASELLTSFAKRIRVLHWAAQAPRGMDVSDVVVAHLENPDRAIGTLTHMLQDVAVTSQDEPLHTRTRHGKPPSFQKIAREYRRVLHMDKTMEEALAVLFAVVLSVNIPGDPLWLFLVGPPGAGKTLFLRSMGSSPYCHYESNLTRTTLVSGFQTPDGEDPSLLQHLWDKCLILKDYTEVLSLGSQVQEELYGILRGAYDGTVRRRFGNNLVREYNCNFSFIAGVTDEIHRDNRALLGERFLRCEFLPHHHQQIKHIRAALDLMPKIVETEGRLQELSADFLDRDLDNLRIPTVPVWVENRIINLSQLIAYLRANVPRNYSGDVIYRVRPEIATRLTTQLAKLGQSLCLVFGKPAVDRTICKILERVAFDTARGWHKDIIHVLVQAHPDSLFCKDVADMAGLPESSCFKRLTDLAELGVVEVEQRNNPLSRGRPANTYRVVSHIMELWKAAKIER